MPVALCPASRAQRTRGGSKIIALIFVRKFIAFRRLSAACCFVVGGEPSDISLDFLLLLPTYPIDCLDLSYLCLADRAAD